MKKLNFKLFLIALLSFAFFSCEDSDEDNESELNNDGPWQIEYRINGVSGSFMNTYRAADGSTRQSLEETAPWQENFTTTDNNKGAIVTAFGENGIPGETVSLEIFVNGVDSETYRTDQFSPVLGKGMDTVDEKGEWDVSLTVVLDNLDI